ncbi:MAG: T9SS type A sorting domain-containing protein [Bacteroidales bacterium]|nr:T9SS type A sorting domain-containing protein [Bacteroidales bacterium]MCF8455053.1 T9SS type A sorting domain-containing protein [Bacteroidales bacterium]
MVRFLSISLLLISINCSLYSQWHLIQDDDSVFWYTGVQFIDDTTGYVVGYPSYESPVPDSLIYGIVLKTNNGGSTWDTIIDHGSYGFHGIHFPCRDTGYVVGYCIPPQIFKTVDGGLNWQTININVTNNALNSYIFSSVYFINCTVGYLTTLNSGLTGSLLRTEDGGYTWSTILLPTDSMFNYPNGKFIDFNNNFAVLSTMWKTMDYGYTWFHDPFPLPLVSDRRVDFFDVDNGILAGRYYFPNLKSNIGAIAVTNNGGQSWATEYFDNFDWLNAVFAINETEVFVAGRSSSYLFMKSPDKGNTWYYQQSYPSSILAQINDIHFPSTNKKVGYAVGSHIFKTINGGGELIPLSLPDNNMPFSNDKFKLYPNPANNIINIKTKDGILNTVDIYSSSGQLLQKTKSNKTQESIDISGLPPGNYFLRAITREGVFVRKFVVVR